MGFPTHLFFFSIVSQLFRVSWIFIQLLGPAFPFGQIKAIGILIRVCTESVWPASPYQQHYASSSRNTGYLFHPGLSSLSTLFCHLQCRSLILLWFNLFLNILSFRGPLQMHCVNSLFRISIVNASSVAKTLPWPWAAWTSQGQSTLWALCIALVLVFIGPRQGTIAWTADQYSNCAWASLRFTCCVSVSQNGPPLSHPGHRSYLLFCWNLISLIQKWLSSFTHVHFLQSMTHFPLKEPQAIILIFSLGFFSFTSSLKLQT